MASYNTTELTIAGYSYANDGYKVVEDTNLRIRRKILNIANLIADYNKRNGASVANIAQNDLIAVLPVFKGEFVKNVYARVITASTATSTAAIGDAVSGLPAASATGWISTFATQTATQTTATPPVLQNGGVIVSDTAAPYVYTTFGTTPAVTAVTGLGKMHFANGSIDFKLIGATAITNGVYEVIAEYAPLTLGVAN